MITNIYLISSNTTEFGHQLPKEKSKSVLENIYPEETVPENKKRPCRIEKQTFTRSLHYTNCNPNNLPFSVIMPRTKQTYLNRRKINLSPKELRAGKRLFTKNRYDNNLNSSTFPSSMLISEELQTKINQLKMMSTSPQKRKELILLKAYKKTYQIDMHLAQQRDFLFPHLADLEYISEFFDHILSTDWNQGNTTLLQIKQQQQLCKKIFESRKDLELFAPDWNKIDEEVEEQAKRTTISSRACNEDLAQTIKTHCMIGISNLRDSRKAAAKNALDIRQSLLLIIDRFHNNPKMLAQTFFKINTSLTSKNNYVLAKKLNSLIVKLGRQKLAKNQVIVHTLSTLLLPKLKSLQNIISQQKKLNSSKGFARTCRAVISIVTALEDQCTNQGLKLTTNFDDQEINPELGCDLEELHKCKQEAMNANLYYELRETAWWNWGKILLDMLLDTLPLEARLREGLREDAIDACEDNTATNCPLEKLAIIVNQVLKLQHNTTSEVCETTLSKCITTLESKLRHTKRAQEKNTSPSWSESFGQSFIGRTVLHYLRSMSAITNVLGTVSRAQAERTKLQAYRSHFHKNLDALQSMLPPNLSNKVEIIVKNPDWDQAKKEVQRFVDWNVNLDKKLAQNEKEVNNSNAITTYFFHCSC
ncbi:hypothetical protein [Candidatus Ichthyocystis hellenicum]|nr:hypothetical protein [Candidatus Ichthyocystis hellenicum]